MSSVDLQKCYIEAGEQRKQVRLLLDFKSEHSK